MSSLASIIIVNWNGKEHLRKCFPSLQWQIYKNIEIVLVDNASTDGSVDYIRKYFPKTKIIVNKNNLGFAEANNVGYKASKGKYVLFLNNDTMVDKNFLVELIKAVEEEKDVGGVQSKILLMDKPKYHDSVGSFFTATGFLYHFGAYKKDGPRYNSQLDLYSARGACMLFKREVLEKVKVQGEIFDSSYFAYFEETDLCHRVLLAGFRMVYVPGSVIHHKLGGTSERLASAFVHYHSYKNRINSYIKNLGFAKLLKVLPLHISLCLAVSVLYLLRGNFKLALAIIRAMIWNLIVVGRTLEKRHYIQKRIRSLKDNNFLPAVSKPASLRYYSYVFFGDLRKYVEKKETRK